MVETGCREWGSDRVLVDPVYQVWDSHKKGPSLSSSNSECVDPSTTG